MVPEKRNRIRRTFYEPAPLPNIAERKRKHHQNRNKTEWKSIDRKLRKQWAANLKRYNAMKINEKIAFAKGGYTFPDQPECPAILTGTSSIRMRADTNRGVMAHKLFESLPKGFIILFSKLEVTDVQHRGDLQACYQVSLHGGRFLLTHTVETPPHGLAQIINHPVCDDPEMDVDPLVWHTQQNMTVANATLKISKRPISPQNIEDFPAYVSISKPVYKGFEVLYKYGSGHRLTRPAL